MEQMTRRGVMMGAMALPLAAGLSGCAGLTGGFSLEAAVRRLMELSSQQAFASLLQPGGFYDSQVARINPPRQFAMSSGLITQILSSSAIRTQLSRTLNDFAEQGARRAAPIVTTAIQDISITDAIGIVRGGPTAATRMLQANVGNALIPAMVPEITQIIRIANNPLLGRAMQAASGINPAALAEHIGIEANRGIWSAMEAEETRIRANPRATNDSLLIAVFTVAGSGRNTPVS
jgi:hypothetical protein